MKLERQIEDLQALRASQWLEVLKDARPEDMQAFRDWCAESPVHIREFLEISCVDRDLAELDPDRQEDLQALLREIRPGVRSLPGALNAQEGVPTRRRRGLFSWNWALAAAVAACALGAGWYLRSWSASHEYSTRVGELRTIELGDTSLVTLNTDSDIKIAFEKNARDIELRHGEAVFKVARDPDRPFRVHTRAGVVQAIGTQFNVYDRAEGVDVSVLEGRVRLTPGTAGRTPDANVAELVAGEQARIRVDGTIERAERADVERVIAWSTRRLKFDDTPLNEIVREFNRYHQNITVRTEGIAAGSHRYTGIFDADDPGTLARFLEQEPDLVVERSDREIVIRARSEGGGSALVR